MVPDYIVEQKTVITFLHPDNNSVEPCAVLFSSKSRRKEAAILKEERERKWGSRKGLWYRALDGAANDRDRGPDVVKLKMTEYITSLYSI